MLNVQRLDLEKLTPEKRAEYALLLPPKYRCCLEGKDPYGINDVKIIALGAEDKDSPIGLIVASVYDFQRTTEVFHFTLKGAYLTPELGKLFLETLEKESKKEKATVIVYSYRKGEPQTPFIESLFQNARWSGPRLLMVRCFYDCYTFNPPWYRNPPKLPKDYKEFPWKDLSKENLKELQTTYSSRGLDQSISPFNVPFEPINSIALSHKGQVIGWMVTNRAAPDTIKYTALYVRPEYQFKGYPIRLLVDSITLQQKSPIKWSIFEINVDLVDRSWYKFVMKRLAPYAIKVDLLYQFWKPVGSSHNSN